MPTEYTDRTVPENLEDAIRSCVEECCGNTFYEVGIKLSQFSYLLTAGNRSSTVTAQEMCLYLDTLTSLLESLSHLEGHTVAFPEQPIQVRSIATSPTGILVFYAEFAIDRMPKLWGIDKQKIAFNTQVCLGEDATGIFVVGGRTPTYLEAEHIQHLLAMPFGSDGNQYLRQQVFRYAVPHNRELPDCDRNGRRYPYLGVYQAEMPTTGRTTITGRVSSPHSNIQEVERTTAEASEAPQHVNIMHVDRNFRRIDEASPEPTGPISTDLEVLEYLRNRHNAEPTEGTDPFRYAESTYRRNSRAMTPHAATPEQAERGMDVVSEPEPLTPPWVRQTFPSMDTPELRRSIIEAAHNESVRLQQIGPNVRYVELTDELREGVARAVSCVIPDCEESQAPSQENCAETPVPILQERSSTTDVSDLSPSNTFSSRIIRLVNRVRAP